MAFNLAEAARYGTASNRPQGHVPRRNLLDLTTTYVGLPSLPSWRRIRQRDTPVCYVRVYTNPSRQADPVGFLTSG